MSGGVSGRTCGAVRHFSALRKYDRNAFLDSLEVKTFSEQEISNAFERLQVQAQDGDGDGVVSPSDISDVIRTHSQGELSSEEITLVTNEILKDLVEKNTGLITRESFGSGMREMGGRFDKRVKPLVACYLITGTTIGIIVPCMPLLVSELNISSSQFGLIVSSFGLAKLLGNIPSSHYVNVIGRKPLFFSGLGLASVAIGGIGLSLNPAFGYPWIVCCRLLTGLGVSAIVAGGNMMVADISTYLNRTQTQAPLMSAWQMGMIAGPGVGGLLIDTFGLANTYYSVGGGMLLVSAISQLFVQETKPHVFGLNKKGKSVLKVPKEQLSNSVQTAFASWRRLLHGNQELKNVVLLNGSYWAVMSGVQLTMLPLLMVNPVLNMSASQIGFTFISLSLVSLAMAQPLAYLADNYNKNYMFVAGCALLGGSSIFVPFATSPEQLAMLMVPFAVGSTVMQNVPTAHVVNICGAEDAPQAMSLLRTVGDLGLIVGAATSGMLASLTSVETVIQGQGSILFATLAYIGYQKHLTAEAAKKQL